MSIQADKELCCGCGVCVLVCPKKAIRMILDEEGFLYPDIDINKCIECGLCKIKCAFKKAINSKGVS